MKKKLDQIDRYRWRRTSTDRQTRKQLGREATGLDRQTDSKADRTAWL